MAPAFNGFLVGFAAPARGLEMILRRPRIRHAAIVPFVAVLLVFIVGILVGIPALYYLIPSVSHMLMLKLGLTAMTTLDQILYYGVIALTVPVALFGLLFLLFLASQLLAAPFYALLAERVLVETALLAEQPFRAGEWLRNNLHLLMVALLKVAVFGALGLILMALSILPGIGIFSAFGLLMMTAFDIADISFEALKMGFRDRLRFFREEFVSFVGLACALGLIFLVPGLNFFMFPAAIAGVSGILRFAQDRKRGSV